MWTVLMSNVLWSQTIPSTRNARTLKNQNFCCVEIIKEEKWVENFRCGAVMVTKRVKTPKKYIRQQQNKMPYKKKKILPVFD